MVGVLIYVLVTVLNRESGVINGDLVHMCKRFKFLRSCYPNGESENIELQII